MPWEMSGSLAPLADDHLVQDTAVNLVTNPSARATSGTVVVRENLATNPSLETALATWSGWGGDGGVAVRTLETSGGIAGSNFVRTTWTTASTGFSGGVNTSVPHSPASFAGGDVITASGYVRSSRARRMVVGLSFRNSSGASVSLSYGSSVLVEAGVWTRISHTATAPADATGVEVRLYNSGGSGQVSWAVGDTLDADAVLVEKADTLGDYFDGSTPIRNLHPDPFVKTGDGWQNTRWFGSGATGSYSVQTGPGAVGNGFRRKTWNTVPGGGAAPGDTGFQVRPTDVDRVVAPGEQISVSGWMRSSRAGQVLFARVEFALSGGGVTRISGAQTIAEVAGAWYRVEVTGTAPAGAVTFTPLLDVTSAGPRWQVGDTLDGDGVVVERSATPTPYVYEGAGDFTYEWAGPPHASASRQIATVPVGANPSGAQVTVWKHLENGESLSRWRINQAGVAIGTNYTDAPQPAGIVHTYAAEVRSSRALTVRPRAGTTATTAAPVTLTPNTWTPIRWTWDGGTTVGGPGFVVFASDGHQPGDIIDVRRRMMVQGDYTGTFFDGGTTNARWHGGPDASTSEYDSYPERPAGVKGTLTFIGDLDPQRTSSWRPGDTWINVATSDDPRFTDARPPSGPAGGALAGAYPNPTLASSITTAVNFTNGVRGNITARTDTDPPSVYPLGYSTFSTSASTGTTWPESGYLTVATFNQNGTSRAFQLAVSKDNGRSYIRSFSGTDSWTAWKEIVTTTDLAAYLKTADAPALMTPEAAIQDDKVAGMLRNGGFELWTAAAPQWWVVWGSGPTKETALRRSGTNAARWVTDATTNAGMYATAANASLSELPTNLEYVTLEVDFQLVSGSLNGVGFRVDWTGGGTNPYAFLALKDEVPSPQLGKWYRVTKTVRRPTLTSGVTGHLIYLFTNYESATPQLNVYGGKAVKDIIIDRVTARAASSAEVAAFNAVQTTDSRLSDARTPTAHTHSGADINSGKVPIAQIPTVSSGVSSATAVPLANDSRLSNARPPTGGAGGDLQGTYPNPTLAPTALQPVHNRVTTFAMAAHRQVTLVGGGAKNVRLENDSLSSIAWTEDFYNQYGGPTAGIAVPPDGTVIPGHDGIVPAQTVTGGRIPMPANTVLWYSRHETTPFLLAPMNWWTSFMDGDWIMICAYGFGPGFLAPRPASSSHRWGTGELDDAWRPLTLLNGWAKYGGAGNTLYASPAYRKVGNQVEVTGLITGGITTVGTFIGHMPVGFRPAEMRIFTIMSNNGAGYIPGRVDVYPTGELRIENVGNSFASLDGITYRAEQ